MTPQERQEFEQLKELVNQLMRVEHVPFIKNIERRVEIGATASSKTAASATRNVNEAGASSYTVMYAPTGFISIDGYNVPYIN